MSDGETFPYSSRPTGVIFWLGIFAHPRYQEIRGSGLRSLLDLV
jgi:hypothetical protein